VTENFDPVSTQHGVEVRSVDDLLAEEIFYELGIEIRQWAKSLPPPEPRGIEDVGRDAVLFALERGDLVDLFPRVDILPHQVGSLRGEKV